MTSFVHRSLGTLSTFGTQDRTQQQVSKLLGACLLVIVFGLNWTARTVPVLFHLEFGDCPLDLSENPSGSRGGNHLEQWGQPQVQFNQKRV